MTRGYGGDVLLEQADGFGKEHDTTSGGFAQFERRFSP